MFNYFIVMREINIICYKCYIESIISKYEKLIKMISIINTTIPFIFYIYNIIIENFF